MNTHLTTFFVEPTLDHCQKIAEAIKNENILNPHMVNQTAEQIFDDVQNAGGASLILADGTLIGFIKLKKIVDNFQNTGSVYERGGLFVFPEFRSRGFAKKLIKHILEKNSDDMMYGVTSVDAVKGILSSLGHTPISREIISNELLNAIESHSPLSQNDEIFVSPKLLEVLKK